MFVINDDQSIYVTRGDIVMFSVQAEDNAGRHVFKEGDVIRFKVFEKKACENVVLQKDTLVEADVESVEIMLSRHDTKIGDVISKPTDYWYEVELNPFTNPQTIVGYDDDGTKVFRLYPEGADIPAIEDEDDIPLVDDELDATSERPIQNQAITRALIETIEMLREEYANADAEQKKELEDLISAMQGGDGLLNYVKNTDYATKTVGGVVKVGSESMGVMLNADNTLVIAGAGASEIQEMASANRPITPYYLKQAVKTGLVKNDLEWTDEEKATVRGIVGAVGTAELEELGNKALKKASATEKDANSLKTLGIYNVGNTDESWSNLPVGATTGNIVVIENYRITQIGSFDNGVFWRYITSPTKTFEGVEWNRLVRDADVIDNLLSDATDLPLSANMGKKLAQALNLNCYVGWAQLGKDYQNLASWAGVLPAGSLFIVSVNNADYPKLFANGLIPRENNGVLIVVNANSRGFGVYYSNGLCYLGHSNNIGTSSITWVDMARKSDLDGYLPSTGGSINGSLTVSTDVSAKNVKVTGAVQCTGSGYVSFPSKGSIKSPSNQSMYFAASNESAYTEFFGVMDGAWTRCPSTDGNLALGTSAHRYSQLFAKTSTISTSDRNLKKDIKALTEQHLKFFRLLQPVSFVFIDGASGRSHIGFIAQDVEEAMKACGLSDLDFAGFCKNQKYNRVEKMVGEELVVEETPIEGEYIHSLRYEEFIALVAQATQEALNRIEAIEKRLNALENKQ